MRLEIHHSVAARRDLRGIWHYIAADNEAAANALLRRIMQTLDRLAVHPKSGRARAELGADVRSVSLGNYLIFYRFDAERLHLVRVVNGAIDLTRIQLDD